MTKSEVVSLVALASAAYPSAQDKDPDPIVKAWMLMLSDMSYPIAKAAVVRVCRSSRFFPSIAEIVTAAREIDPRCEHLPTAAEAWEEVAQLMRKAGPTFVPTYSCDTVKRAARAIGWNNLCYGENVDANRAHFLRLYEAMREKREETREFEAAIQLSGAGEVIKTLAAGMGQH
jgi:hypothetical protein